MRVWGCLCSSSVSFRLRPRKIVPADFTARFLDRLYEGKLDCGEALDHCERNPSPAAQWRWRRSDAGDDRRPIWSVPSRWPTKSRPNDFGATWERCDASRRWHRYWGCSAPCSRLSVPCRRSHRCRLTEPSISVESALPSVAWGPALAAALSPLSAGIIIATLALVAYDGLLTRIEKQAGALDRLGAETIDAIALAAPISTPIITLGNAPSRTPHQLLVRRDGGIDAMSRSGPAETGP